MYKQLFLLISLLGAVCSARAGDKVDFTASAGAGILHDSNVGLAAIDSSTGEGDSGSEFEAGLGIRFKTGDVSHLQFAYDYTGTQYQRFSEFDLALHRASVEIGTSGFGIDATLTAERYSALLDGDDYLQMNRVSPAVARLFGTSLYLRGAYALEQKRYDELSDRNANSASLRVDGYWLLDGMSRYLAIGLQSSAEDAANDELDYNAFTTMLTYGQSGRLGFMPLTFKAQLRFESRDFDSINSEIETLRRDDRVRGSVSAAIPFSDHVKLEAQVEKTRNASNLPSAELDKLVYRLGLAASF